MMRRLFDENRIVKRDGNGHVSDALLALKTKVTDQLLLYLKKARKVVPKLQSLAEKDGEKCSDEVERTGRVAAVRHFSDPVTFKKLWVGFEAMHSFSYIQLIWYEGDAK